jgi:2,3-dihydroxybiphenyl 1,2-dioxygenase
MTSPHAIELAYLGVEVADRAALGAFLQDTVGLIPGDPTPDDAETWRNDAKAQRLLVSEGPANDGRFVGIGAVDVEAWEKTVARLHGAGYATSPGSASEKADRRVADLVHTQAPWGMRVEVVHTLAEAAEPYSSAQVQGGFLTAGLGFGHVVVATTAFEESHHFVTEGLGMQQSDWVETEIAAGIELEVRFYHCNERHHSLAVARAPFDLPQTLHHVMFEVNDRDDVGRAFDRAWNQGLTIANGLGRHDNDGMFSFYVVSPAGFQVEVGHGARRTTPEWDGNRRYDRISIWGHQPLGQREGAGAPS